MAPYQCSSGCRHRLSVAAAALLAASGSGGVSSNGGSNLSAKACGAVSETVGSGGSQWQYAAA